MAAPEITRTHLFQLAGSLEPPVRYIKLGRGGAWADEAIRAANIPLGFPQVPHELALRGDRAAIIAHLSADGRSPGKAASFAREVLDFYTLGPEAIWMTFANGHLWWARAEAEVVAFDAPADEPQRRRQTIGGWRNTDLKGQPLREGELSTRLTKVAAYRQAVCAVEAEAYLFRKLEGLEDPLVTEALAAQAAVVAAAERLIATLHWADFETLVALILARGGWSRVSALGGNQKDADLVVEQPVTDETALVQIKSAATQAVLDDYLDRFDRIGTWSRMIFACHSPAGALDAKGRPDVILWDRRGLAEAAARAGLSEWLIQRVG